jgi:hypothetical protein
MYIEIALINKETNNMFVGNQMNNAMMFQYELDHELGLTSDNSSIPSVTFEEEGKYINLACNDY